MMYIKVYWKHNFKDEPMYIYIELDKNRNENRKVEVYRNNLVGYDYKNISVNGTFLSKVKIPTISNINKDTQFEAIEICKKDFELIWDKAIITSSKQ